MDKYRGFQNQGPRPMPHASSVIIQGKWKLLADSLLPVEVFNLSQDHRELYNLLGEDPELDSILTKRLVDFMEAPRVRSGFIEKTVSEP